MKNWWQYDNLDSVLFFGTDLSLWMLPIQEWVVHIYSFVTDNSKLHYQIKSKKDEPPSLFYFTWFMDDPFSTPFSLSTWSDFEEGFLSCRQYPNSSSKLW